MNEKDFKELFKDLCGRFPYGVVCKMWFVGNSDSSIIETLKFGGLSDFYNQEIMVMPYLRPMLSMTAEEEKEFLSLKCGLDVPDLGDVENIVFNTDSIDWLNEHQFDYRGFIKRGLALEAPENIYSYIKKQTNG